MSADLSRRSFFAAFRRPFAGVRRDSAPHLRQREEVVSPARVAVVQGRFCLALTSFCRVCVERCPVPGAMKPERGMPLVVPDVCTGCGICQEVCPAPRNAILLLPRRQPSPLKPA